jgi:hypothetical protein
LVARIAQVFGVPQTRRRGLLLVAAYLVCALVVNGGNAVRAGAVRTLDGRAFDGEVRLDRGGANLVIDTGASTVKIELANVLDATLRPIDRATPPDRGVLLVDGGVVAGMVLSIDERNVRLRRAGVAQPIDAPIDRVARVMFQPASAELAAKAPSNAATTGVLLSNGDFFEGTLRSFDGRALRVDSVLFGPAAFDVNQQAVQLVLRPTNPAGASGGGGGSIVRLTDGSSIGASGFKVEGANLKIASDLLGSISVRLEDVAQIHAGGGQVQPLAEMTPNVTGNGDGGTFAVDATNVGLSPMVNGVQSQRVVTITNGAQVTYPLNGGQPPRLFTSRAGVPAAVLPTVAVRFIVLLDGREAWRSGARTSLDEPLDVSVKIGDAKKTLTLTVETTGPRGAAVGAIGAWCDPALVLGER